MTFMHKRELMVQHRPLFLVGLSGVGKTTIGKVLAGMLEYSFVDTDAQIEQEQDNSIAAIFTSLGQDTFRRLETELLEKLLPLTSVVVATGGGLPCYGCNMMLMLQHGQVVYLDSPLEVLAQRLFIVKDSRPLVAKMSKLQIKTYLEEAHQQRHSYYSQAHHRVIVGELITEEQVQAVAREIYGIVTSAL